MAMSFNEGEKAMLNKALVAAALAAASSVALAHPPHWAPAYGYRAHYYPRPVVRYYPVVPRPVIVAPAPVIVPPPGIVVRLRLPL